MTKGKKAARSALNLASPPHMVDPIVAEKRIDRQLAKAAKISRRAANDSAVMGYGSAMDIPRTSLAKGGYFGEPITSQALRFTIRREPIAKRIVVDVAGDVFDKWFKIIPIEGSTPTTPSKTTEASDQAAEPESNKLDANVNAVLEALNAKPILTQAAEYERGYGWSVIILGFKDDATDLSQPATNPQAIDHLAVYSPLSTTVDKEDLEKESDRFGLPLIYKIDRGKNQYMKVHYSRVIHVATRLDEHPWKGVSVLENIWDDLTVYRNIRWAAGQVYWRLCGIMKFKFPKDYKKAEIDNFFASLGDPNARSWIGLPDDKDVEILSVAGRVPSPQEFSDISIRSISMGTGLPKQKLEGTEAGAVTGSEVNQREYYKFISDQQKLYEGAIVGPLIDKLMEIGQVKPDVDYSVEWLSAFEMEPTLSAEVRLKNSQASVNELEYRLIDEVRARDGDKPLAEASEGKISGQRMAEKPAQTTGQLWGQKPAPPEGKNV